MPPQPYEKSNYEMLREGGYHSMHEFLHSHSLKLQPGSYEEAREILDGFREIDQRAWEEQHGYQSEEDWDEEYYDEQEALEYQYYEQELLEERYNSEEYGDEGEYGQDVSVWGYEDEIGASEEYSEPEYTDQEDWDEGYGYYSDESDDLY
ncbi:uncharacterized protein ACHE_30339A [Aspergillus chevalieri]|uniref:Uncharacterized protein n=1 Tax=Aspergillus chevalieri TaxID=182096 RepID=A0A7R7VKG6_ASPCH|nr:uncharacterized protein ACHE_30339A [Aspergillus chevalieri]BCR86352.1 hypothetical protein ACHE_30339A [Aspergillus chevalieri]